MILIQLYVVFLAVGTLAFGGGYAMLPFIKSLLVNNMHWITAAQFTSYIGICQIAPGPVSVNLTYFVGFKLAGVPGGILAMIGLCTTPFILVSIAFKAFSKFKDSVVWNACLKGMKPALIALLLSALVMVCKTAYIGKTFNGEWHEIVITMISGILLFSKKVHPIFIIILAAVLGIVFQFVPLFN